MSSNIKGRKSRHPQLGFTLIELLVVIGVLGTLAAVVMLNVTKFVNAAAPVALDVERKHVHTAAVLYIVDGNTLSGSTTVGPGNKGILAPWLSGELQYYWTINADGSLSSALFGSSLNSLSGFTTVSGSWVPGAGGLSAGPGGGSLVVSDGNWSDFSYQTTATILPGSDFSMTYRGDGTNDNGYVIQYNSAGNTLTVSIMTNGVISAPIASASMPAGFSGSHSFSVSTSGSSHTISVDGGTVSTFNDGTYTSGTVGLQAAGGSSVNFTGFTVSPP